MKICKQSVKGFFVAMVFSSFVLKCTYSILFQTACQQKYTQKQPNLFTSIKSTTYWQKSYTNIYIPEKKRWYFADKCRFFE